MRTPKLTFGYGEAPGEGFLRTRSVTCGTTPTPTLPGKRERGLTSVAATIKPNPIAR